LRNKSIEETGLNLVEVWGEKRAEGHGKAGRKDKILPRRVEFRAALPSNEH